MAAALSIVLKAVDQYSGVLTGLNQGFELVGKAINLVQGAADLAFDAIKSGVNLAAQGGDYAEVRRQFNTVADSFEVDGQKILESLDSVTLNMIGLKDAAQIAGRGITAGLSEPQLETAFEFIKRRTELTGEDFNSLSQQVFRAISSGRTSILSQMGLVIESGATIEEVVQAMSVATAQYGDAGFNAADKISALANQQNKFTTAIGVAINETPAFQRILTQTTDAVIALVNTFDPRPISVFLDFAIRGVEAVVGNIVQSVPFLADLWDALWAESGEGAGGFAKTAVDSVFSVVRSVGRGVNSILDFLTGTGITSALEFLASGFVTTFGVVLEAGSEIFGLLFSTVVEGFSEMIGLVGDLARDFPQVADFLGIDPLALANTEQSLKVLARGISQSSKTIADGVEDTTNKLNGMIAGAAEGARTWRIDLESVDEVQADILESLDAIDYSKKWGEFSEEGTRSVSGIAQQLAGLEGIGIDDIDVRVNADEASQALDAFDDKVRQQRALKLDLEGEGLRDEIKATIEATDWPQELRQVFEFFLTWVLAKASGERVPLAVATI